jgi:peptidoglycan lytic transglycosylase
MNLHLKKLTASITILPAVFCLCLFSSCGAVKTGYRVTKGTVTTTYRVVKGTAKVAFETGKVAYKVGKFTFYVVMAPLSWPLTQPIDSINGLPPKEAIRKGQAKRSPYVVNGRRYVPFSMEKAEEYHEKGIASWYGNETFKKKGGHMTADGEAFDPDGLNAAHKYLPLPSYVRVTNLENGKQIIVRVNDRGPFVDGRIIDLSAGAARRLGYFRKGTARVLVETVKIEG